MRAAISRNDKLGPTFFLFKNTKLMQKESLSMTDKIPTCCETMDQQLNKNYCSQHGYDCPEYLMRASRRGHWMLDSGGAWYGCHFCPWCGTEVPEPYNSEKWENSLSEDWEDDLTWETEE